MQWHSPFCVTVAEATIIDKERKIRKYTEAIKYAFYICVGVYVIGELMLAFGNLNAVVRAQKVKVRVIIKYGNYLF